MARPSSCLVVCLSVAGAIDARKPGGSHAQTQRSATGRSPSKPAPIESSACRSRPTPPSPGAPPSRPRRKHCGGASWTEQTTGGVTTISTRSLRVRVDRNDRSRPICRSQRQRDPERTGSIARTRLHPGRSDVPHSPAMEAAGRGACSDSGQHQLGLTNIKGYDLDLWQHNATVSLPFLVSSRGYGILWDNTSYSRFGDLRQPSFMSSRPAARCVRHVRRTDRNLLRRRTLRSARRHDVSIRGSTWKWPDGTPESNRRIHPDLPADGDISVRWEGAIRATETGDHLFTTYSNSGIKLWIDDRLVDRSVAPGLAALVRRRARPLRSGPHVPRQARMVERPRHRDDAIAMEDAGSVVGHLAVVRGRRRRRLLLRVRAGSRRRRRRLPRGDRSGTDDAALGVRVLAVPRAVQDRSGKPGRRS